MHCHAEMWIEDNQNAAEQVASILAPFDEKLRVEWREDWGELWNPHGFWEFWEIGGRFKGRHVPGYDIRKDPENYEVCKYCAGTGQRPGMIGCNACSGTGRDLRSDYPPHEKDVIPVSDIPPDFVCYLLIVGDAMYPKEINDEDGQPIETNFDGRVASKLKELDVQGGYLVTVDYRAGTGSIPGF